MTLLPARISKAPKRATRWRSAVHSRFVRQHACALCGSTAAIEAAHVRLGSGTGVGQKPDDFRMVGLCRDCHQHQHNIGEATFWHGRDVEALIGAYIAASPKRAEIQRIMRERGHGE